MRSLAISALFALVAVQQAAACATCDAASGNWANSGSLSTCQAADNQCTDEQKKSLTVATANLPQGACGAYAGFELTGLSVGPFGGKTTRDLFTRNGGQSGNCLNGQVSKNSGPSISCGSSIPQKKASITNFQVSVDKDTDVQFVHSYEGSSQTCSYTKKCTAGAPNSIDNSQCGGSSSVKCQLPQNSPHESCNIGVHALQFDCTPGQQHSSSASQSLPSQVPSSPVFSKPESKTYPITVPVGTAPPKSHTVPIFPIPSGSAPPAVPSVPVVSSKNATVPVVPTVPATSPAPSSPIPSAPATSPVSSASASSPSPSAPGTTSAPTEIGSSSSSPAPTESTVEKVTSEIVYSTVTSCPVTNTKTVGSSTSIEVTTSLSTVLITSTKTICTKCVAPKTSSIPSPPESQVPSYSPPAPPASPLAPPASSAAPSVSSAPATPASSPAGPPSSAPTQVGSSSAPAPPASSPAPPASSSPIEVGSSSVPATPASSATAPPQTIQEIVTTAVVYTTLTTCPVTNTVTPPYGTPTQQVTTTVSTITSTSISTVCTKCVAPPASSSAAPPASSLPASSAPVQQGSSVAPPPVVSSSAPLPVVASSSAPPAASPSAPGVLPSCVKTWVTVTKCKDNSDYDCYCKDDVFTQNVFECISAWESEQEQQQAAFSYYAGICAPHVPAHPVIVTAVPSTITLIPTPASPTPIQSSSPAAPVVPGLSSAPIQQATSAVPAAPILTSAPAAPAAPGAPVVTPAPAVVSATTPPPAAGTLPPTTISISTTVTLPCSAVGIANQIPDGQVQASSMASGCTTTSLLQTAVTVPQVAFTTGASSSVGLAAGSPAPAQAAATGPASPAGAPAGAPGVAAGSSSAVVATKPTSAIPFTGAAAKAGPSSVVAVVIGAIAMGIFA